MVPLCRSRQPMDRRGVGGGDAPLMRWTVCLRTPAAPGVRRGLTPVGLIGSTSTAQTAAGRKCCPRVLYKQVHISWARLGENTITGCDPVLTSCRFSSYHRCKLALSPSTTWLTSADSSLSSEARTVSVQGDEVSVHPETPSRPQRRLCSPRTGRLCFSGLPAAPVPVQPATMASSRPVLQRRPESTGSILCITSYYRAHLEFYSAPAGGRAALSGRPLCVCLSLTGRISLLAGSLSVVRWAAAFARPSPLQPQLPQLSRRSLFT